MTSGGAGLPNALDDVTMLREYDRCVEQVNGIINRTNRIYRDIGEMLLYKKCLKHNYDEIDSLATRHSQYEDTADIMSNEIQDLIDYWHEKFEQINPLNFDLNVRLECGKLQENIDVKLHEYDALTTNFENSYRDSLQLLKSSLLPTHSIEIVSSDGDSVIEVPLDDDCVIVGYPEFPEGQ